MNNMARMVIALAGLKLSVLLLVTLPTLFATDTLPTTTLPPTTTTTLQLLELPVVFLTAALIVRYLLPVPTKQRKSLQSCIASLSTFAAYTYRHSDHTFAHLLNPLQFQSPAVWCALLVLKIAALSLLDQIVLKVVRYCLNPAPLSFRTHHPNVKGLVQLQWIDYLYLSMNQVIEYIFMLKVIAFAWTNGNVYWSWTDVSVFNTVAALYMLFVVDDLLYAPSHYFMHWKVVYPYIHKHHHRQILPKRGYTDAGNEHPLEQVLGLSIVWLTMHVVSLGLGLHVGTIVLHFVLYAALALMNHTDMDVSFQLLGFDYSVGAHEMHHRNPDCNMAQYWMGLDKWVLGTYRTYTSGLSSKSGRKEGGEGKEGKKMN